MMRLVWTSLLFLSLSGWTQELPFIFKDTIQEKSWISLTGFNYYSSNRFNNDYMDKWLFGGVITDEIKNETLSKLKSVNAIGMEAENGISYYAPGINLFKKENAGMVFSITDQHFFSGSIPTDLYKVAMYGNSSSIGDTLDFNFANFQYQHYQKFSIGIFDEKTLSSVKLSYVGGSKTANFRFSEAWMYTHPAVDTLELYTQAFGFTSDKFYPYFGFYGSGFALDIDYNFIFSSKKGNRQVVNFRMNNLGAIFWNRNTDVYAVDSLNYYAGFDIRDFINQDTSANTNVDIMDTLGVVHGRGYRTDFLPVELSLQKAGDQGSAQKLQLIFGFKAILTANYVPYFYVGGYYKPADNFSVSSRVAYGGFGGFKWGLSANYWLKDRLYIGIGSFDVLGLASKKIGYGRGVNFMCNIKL